MSSHRIFTAQNAVDSDSWIEFLINGAEPYAKAYYYGQQATLTGDDDIYGTYGTFNFHIPALAGQYLPVYMGYNIASWAVFDLEGNGQIWTTWSSVRVAVGEWEARLDAPIWVEENILSPVNGKVTMIGTGVGGNVYANTSYFCRIYETGSGTSPDVLVRPARDGICTAVNITYDQMVTTNQVLGRYKYKV